MPLMFVYGTLKRGERLNPYYFGDSALATFIAPVSTDEAIYEMRTVPYGGFPYVIHTRDIVDQDGEVVGSSIAGEVWSVHERVFNVLQAMEEAVGYHAEQINIGRKYVASIFVLDHDVNGHTQEHISIYENTKYWSTQG
ncbi:hypothetical protein LCGC14_2146470 [marine sediment metagenome]|uniref:Gamma-glutamylcyclotransferase AIG2-like domain-containing protein n=1 Tax=marine sediment metagenome TaxID=412755 RepID=A0A0F9GT66_9ZZZZ